VHLADEDEYVSDDEAVFMEATMRLENLKVEVVRRRGTRHGFAEPDGDTFDPIAFDDAWAKTLGLLETQLRD
jgi:dienelactone hydrolase